MAIMRTLWTLRTVLVIVLTPVLLSPLLVYGSKQGAAGFCLLLMAIYWLTEAFPIAITALLPVLLFPVTGIMTGKQVSATYINDSSMLFVGGLIMAVAIEHWNIHKRIALKILMVIGTEPNRLMLGMMLPAWFLSMWTSNIATTAMMMPIADALLHELQKGECELDANEHDNACASDSNGYGACAERELNKADEPFHASNHLSMTESQVNSELGSDSREVTEPCKEKAPSREHLQMAKALTISIAYSASIGGTTTLTGCASNIILKGMADQIFKEKRLDSGLSFGTWLVIGFPVSLIIFIAMFLWLIFYFRGCSCFTKTGKTSGKLRHFIKQEYISLGPIRFPEVMVISLFLLLVVLWVSRDLGGAGGWGNLFKSDYVTDSAAPTLVAALLFLIPANLLDFLKTKGRPVAVKPLLTWRAVNDKVPWGLFLLFGGGFALAQACKVSGLSESIRDALTVFQELPVWLTSFLVALITSMITEVVTNTATCTLVLPIISQLALGIGVNPLYLMIPTAVATSYAFMLPVATPPNAMVYSMGYFSISEMMRCGFILNLVSVLVLTLGVNTWGAQYFRLAHLPAEFITTTTTTGYVSTMSTFNSSVGF